MALSLGMMYCAVRIIGDKPVSDHKKHVGTERGAIGTGFIVTVASETHPNVSYAYLLTAHHVIAPQTKVEVQPADPFNEGELYPPVAIKDWRKPLDGVDLAIAPFEAGRQHEYQVLATPIEWGMIPNEMIPHGPYLGASIFYIGLLAPEDRPMARSGTIGALDQEKLRFKEGYDYIAHLMDCRSYGGFSGSPCFVEVEFAKLTPVPGPIPGIPEDTGPVGEMGHLALLCGMFTAHRTDEDSEENLEDTVSRYGVGVMLRGQEIREALMTDGLRKERYERDAEIATAASDGSFENATVASPDMSDFDRFEDLARKLVQVPKAEIDEKRNES